MSVLPARGRMCGRNAADVRPRWGHLLVRYGTLGLALYFACVLGVCVALRAGGFPARFGMLVWPPAWNRLNAARAEHLCVRARAYLSERNLLAARLCLENAGRLDRRNYQAGALLAQLVASREPGYADSLLRSLLVSHPEHAEETAQRWLQTLLARGDFSRIATLAAERLAAGSPAESAWLHALFFAVERTAASAVLVPLGQGEGNLSPSARAMVQLFLRVQAAAPSDLADVLAPDGEDPARWENYRFYFVCERLIRADQPDRALALLARRPRTFPDRDVAALYFDAIAQADRRSALMTDLQALLAAPLAPPVLEMLALHIIRHPDPEVTIRIWQSVSAAPLLTGARAYPAYLALFCAFGVNRDADAARGVAERIAQTAGIEFAASAPLYRYLSAPQKGEVLGNFLPLLEGLPSDVSYALWSRVR